MDRVAVRPKGKRITVVELSSELGQLRQRVEELEDLRDLNIAIKRNGGKSGTPWDHAKKDLGL